MGSAFEEFMIGQFVGRLWFHLTAMKFKVHVYVKM